MPEFMRLYRAAPEGGDPGDAMTFIASSPGPKRDGLDLDQRMWYLDNYRKNPVFLWAHDYTGRSLPIGRAEVVVDGGLLRCAVSFDQKDEFARRVEQKYRDGYLHAVSVGWNPVETDGRQMYDLLDISAVPVPGDPDALKERQLAGMRGIYSDIQRLLDAEVVAETRELTPADDPLPEPAAPALVEAIDYRELSRAILTTLAEKPAAEPTCERGGAVISKRNMEDLRQAADLINGVISRATKTEEPSENFEGEEDSVARYKERPRPAVNFDETRAAPEEAATEDNAAAEDCIVPVNEFMKDNAAATLARVFEMLNSMPHPGNSDNKE